MHRRMLLALLATVTAIVLILSVATDSSYADDPPSASAAPEVAGTLDTAVHPYRPLYVIGANGDALRLIGSDAPIATPGIATSPVAPPGIAAELERLRLAYEALKGTTGSARTLAIAGVLAALCYFLIAGLKSATSLDFNPRLKRWIPWGLLGLGVLAGFLSWYSAGNPLLVAVVHGAGPPLGVLAHELLKLFKPPATAR